MKVQILLALLVLLDVPMKVSQAAPNFVETTQRPLRYRPDGADFVIENGREYFNRPLYIRNTAMRVDAGDRPEFSLYLPGRGGNVRLGVRIDKQAKWLDEASNIIARYRPGEMLYDVRDPSMGDGSIRIRLMTLADADGIVVQLQGHGLPAGAEAVFTFGGVNGDKGKRNGDIGCESVPVSEFFRFKPEYCAHNTISLRQNRFLLTAKSMSLVGIGPEVSTLWAGDATKRESVSELLQFRSGESNLPMLVAASKFEGEKPLEWILEKGDDDQLQSTPVPQSDLAERRVKDVREKVVIDTPDPFINAAAGAVNVAADGVWDEKQGAVMHGAVAWRVKLLGWRGPYANDVLGWHDRAARHLTYWAGQQNTSAIPATQPGPDESANLSRSEAALHSNGDISHSHYDMNLVYIDALFRHLMWTGDLKMARDLWPVIQRHIAWERRLFRREFGEEKLPLYEAYCCIWASDDVYYSGGGATHATAYNYWHNRMAARIARAIGEDPTEYDREADLIWKGLQQLLWVNDTGCFAESKDLLGLQLLHPAAAVWTVYHTIDSHACTPQQARSMTEYLDRTIARIPIHGPGVPDENLYTIPTTNWMPYTWSTNNVVMAEVAHTSLAYWQAGRPDDAFRLFKGCLLDSMYMELCPGNVGMCTTFDMARGESQRDFADGVGMTSRALVEGLFGVQPDAIAGELLIQPGFPDSWDHASIRHPDFSLSFKREGDVDAYVIEQRFAKPMKIRFLRSLKSSRRITINGGEIEPTDVSAESPGMDVSPVQQQPEPQSHEPDAHATFQPIDLTSLFNDRVTHIFKHDYVSPRSPFCSLSLPRQGIGSWCHPETKAEIDDTGLRRVSDENGGKIILPDQAPLQTPGAGDAKNIAFVSQWKNFPSEIEIPLQGAADRAVLLMAGTTNSMQSRFDNGEVIATYTDGTTDRLALHNPTNWWPIEQDYLIDDYAFKRPEPLPMRVDLKTGQLRVLEMQRFKGQGGSIHGGAATVLQMPLNPDKPLKSLTVRALANDVVIGLMSATLVKEPGGK